MSLSSRLDKQLTQAVEELRAALGAKLHSLSLYGSAVRGELSRHSDLNLMVVLTTNDPDSLVAIRRIVRRYPRVQPLILECSGLQRDFRTFAPKFAGIRRSYKLLHGEDVLAQFAVPSTLERFLVEQGTRNLRMRLTHAFAVSADNRRTFSWFLMESAVTAFTQLATALRLEGTIVPASHAERAAVLESAFGAGDGVLADLLALKAKPRKLGKAEIDHYFQRLDHLLDAALEWMEAKWPLPLSA